MGEALKKIEEIDRTKFIGGSDAPAVLGLSRWSSPLKVWALKRGEITEDISDRLSVKLGVALEDTVANLFMEETGKKVRRVNEIIYHPLYDFIGAHIDRRVVGEKAILECKTTSAWKAKEWEGEEIPREYILQCCHYLAVTGADRCYLAVLIGNQDFKIKIIERDEPLLREIVAKEVYFWREFVIPGEMPKVITKNDGETLNSLYPMAEEGQEVQLGDDAAQIIETLEGMKQDAKHLEGLIDQKENELKAMIKENEVGVLGDRRVFWSNRKARRLDTNAIKKERPEIYEQFTKENVTRYFQIKKIEQGGI